MTQINRDTWDFDGMLADLRSNRRFAFVRYSDGDWNCVFQRTGGIAEEHTYRPDLGNALRSAIYSAPDYHLGLMPSMLTPDKWWASHPTIEFVESHPDLRWCSSMILHKASMAGRLGEFFNALQYSQREIVLISHAGMYAMTPWLGKFIHYVIPDHDCWDRREAIGHVIQKAAEKDRILLFACSMPAKVWIRKAWNADGAAALIDVGSVFDPYINDNSRTYMQRSEHKLAAPLYDSPAKGNGNEVT